MAKLPAFQFYTGDWLKEPKLSMCQPLTRGIWIDLLCAMHENDQSGEITGTICQIARLCRCTTDELLIALNELAMTKTADILQDSTVTFALQNTDCNSIVTVICRRMHKQAKTRKHGRERVKRHRQNNSNADVTPSRARTSSSSSSYTSTTTSVTPTKQSSSDDESQEEFLIRLQLENPRKNVAESFKEYTADCRKRKWMPKRQLFIKWLANSFETMTPPTVKSDSELPTPEEVIRQREEFSKNQQTTSPEQFMQRM